MPGRHPAQIGMKKAAAKLAFFLSLCYTKVDYQAFPALTSSASTHL